MRIVLLGKFDRYSPDGAEAISLAVALEKAGATVTPMPTEIKPGLPREFTRLLERDPTGAQDVAVAVGDALADVQEVRRCAPHVVLATDRPQDAPLAGWDSVVTPFPVTLPTRVTVIPRGVDCEKYPHRRRDWHTDLRYLVIGPQPLLAAWWRENMDGRELVEAAPATVKEAVEVYHDTHVLVTLARDGDRQAAEYMATGGYVIGLDRWGVLHRDVATPLPAIADSLLRAAVYGVEADRMETQRKAEAAAPWARLNHDWPKVAEKWLQHLGSLL